MTAPVEIDSHEAYTNAKMEQLDLVTIVMCTIVDMLTQNPMVAAVVGQPFVTEMTAVNERLRHLETIKATF